MRVTKVRSEPQTTKIGIYAIKNKQNNQVYIGQSTNIEERWKQHITELNNETHVNKKLQNAWNKYGKDNFEFEILEDYNFTYISAIDKRLLRIMLLCREHYFITKYNALANGYNCENTLGLILSEQHSTLKYKRETIIDMVKANPFICKEDLTVEYKKQLKYYCMKCQCSKSLIKEVCGCYEPLALKNT